MAGNEGAGTERGGGKSAGWLDGRVAVVTGAGTGIGAAVARRFVAEGARVVLVGRRERPLGYVAAALAERALAVPADAAAVVAFLASEHASAVTGAVFTVDGGATAVDLPTIAYDPPEGA